eukprot:4115540-Pyramimonas_sp.AAC.1
MCTGARVHGYPEVLAKTKLSDHAAISVILTPRSQTPPKDRRIHQDVFKRREYQQFIESVLAQIDDSVLSPPLRLLFHKDLMFEAARHACIRLLTGKPHDPLSRYVACRTIARAVWNQDMALARRI